MIPLWIELAYTAFVVVVVGTHARATVAPAQCPANSPFIWTARASDILAKVLRARARLDKLQSV